MGSEIFSGAKRALSKVPSDVQAQMYRQHNASAPTRTIAGNLRGTVHRVTDSAGTVHRLTVVTGRSASGSSTLVVMSPTDVAVAAAYIRQFLPRRQ